MASKHTIKYVPLDDGQAMSEYQDSGDHDNHNHDGVATTQSLAGEHLQDGCHQNGGMPNGSGEPPGGLAGHLDLVYENNVVSKQPEEAPVRSSDPKSQHEEQCGCTCCYPSCLQPLAVPVSYLICICSLVFIQSLVVSGYSSGILTTIEKRYDLWSRELGYIISSYDITTMICGLMVSYVGDRFNRAKVLGRGAFIIGLGSVVFSLPQFIGTNYTYYMFSNSTDTPNICNATIMSSAHQTDCVEEEKNPERWALAIFMLAFMVIGIGASPVYSIGATYLFDNVPAAKFPIYSSLMYAMGALGPAVGFLVAAGCTELWVHPESEAPPGLAPSDAGWVGAWWLGFLAIAAVCVLVGLPLLLFPRSLPGIDHGNPETDKPTFAGYGDHIREFPKVLCKLLCNPTWLLISLVMVVEQSIGTGFNRYIAKYFQVVFNMSVFYSSIIMGVVLIPAAVLGIISGGLLMKKLNLDLNGISRFLLVMNVIPSAATAALLALGCDGINLAGITDFYDLQGNTDFLSYGKPNLTTSCNLDCVCERALYEPVCGTDHVTYYSPCHAGCKNIFYTTDDDGESSKNFTQCSCISGAGLQVAEAGRCDPGCGSLVPFLILLFIVVFCTTLGQNPVLLITLRCVDSGSRSFALGMQNLLIQLISYIPAPIYFGQLFDSTCILWASTCEGHGACQEYNVTKLPMYLFGTCLGFKCLTIILLVVVFMVTWRQRSNHANYDLSTFPEDTLSTSISSIAYSTNDT